MSSVPSPPPSTAAVDPPPPPLAIATRLHLGESSRPPARARLIETLVSFSNLAVSSGASLAILAVDATRRDDGYDLASAIEDVLLLLPSSSKSATTKTTSDGEGGGGEDATTTTTTATTASFATTMRVMPVTPWGKFVPGLNAIVSHCANAGARRVLMISAEIRISKDGVEMLSSYFDDDTLVVGAALRGHDHRRRRLRRNIPASSSSSSAEDRGVGGEEREEAAEVEVELTGRTAPWNTCAIWDVNKLALTGFLLVSEGLHRAEGGVVVGCEGGTNNANTNTTKSTSTSTDAGAAGVEEVATIAVIQRVLSHRRARAKLVMLRPDMIDWDEDFDDDEGRREWHERKMRSKLSRARRQLELLNLVGSGIVIHC
ncbi:hypothetical protein ACHAW5_002046 [Stephanodiscus triporus]|uniref:Uncharacterized protein n=1 Tax=Stephanodiscus triporus TaxID=2934178 RepID=A0ABD3QSE7_9STRA